MNEYLPLHHNNRPPTLSNSSIPQREIHKKGTHDNTHRRKTKVLAIQIKKDEPIGSQETGHVAPVWRLGPLGGPLFCKVRDPNDLINLNNYFFCEFVVLDCSRASVM